MTGFSADWIKLREAVDVASRNAELTAELLAWRQGLAPSPCWTWAVARGSFAISGPIAGWRTTWWLVVDHDPTLLTHGDRLTREWAKRQGIDPIPEWRFLDLVRDWEQLDMPDIRRVVASALIDLVSSDWLERLAQRCRQWQAAAFITLSYDGRIAWEPDLKYDERVCERVNRRQRTEKGFVRLAEKC